MPVILESGNGGLGLGLAIVSRLVDLLGVTVDVRSKVGRGSRFALEMQLMAEPVIKVARASLDLDVHPRSLAGLRILVLDDEATVRDALAQELADHGASAASAARRDDLVALEAVHADLDAAVIAYELAGDTGPEALAPSISSSARRSRPSCSPGSRPPQ